MVDPNQALNAAREALEQRLNNLKAAEARLRGVALAKRRRDSVEYEQAVALWRGAQNQVAPYQAAYDNALKTWLDASAEALMAGG